MYNNDNGDNNHNNDDNSTLIMIKMIELQMRREKNEIKKTAINLSRGPAQAKRGLEVPIESHSASHFTDPFPDLRRMAEQLLLSKVGKILDAAIKLQRKNIEYRWHAETVRDSPMCADYFGGEFGCEKPNCLFSHESDLPQSQVIRESVNYLRRKSQVKGSIEQKYGRDWDRTAHA